MVGGMFMAMVGLEILADKMADKYREFFKKPKILPDVERLHPAELVGTFSRYKWYLSQASYLFVYIYLLCNIFMSS